jgi:hypothetical protein
MKSCWRASVLRPIVAGGLEAEFPEALGEVCRRLVQFFRAIAAPSELVAREVLHRFQKFLGGEPELGFLGRDVKPTDPNGEDCA